MGDTVNKSGGAKGYLRYFGLPCEEVAESGGPVVVLVDKGLIIDKETVVILIYNRDSGIGYVVLGDIESDLRRLPVDYSDDHQLDGVVSLVFEFSHQDSVLRIRKFKVK